MSRSRCRALLSVLLAACFLVGILAQSASAGVLPEAAEPIAARPMVAGADQDVTDKLAAGLPAVLSESGVAPASDDLASAGHIWLTSHTNQGTYSCPSGSVVRVTFEAMDQNDWGYYYEVIAIWDTAIQDFVRAYTYDTYVYYARSGYADVDLSGLAVSSGRYQIVAFLWDDIFEEIEDAEYFNLTVTPQNVAPVASPDTYAVSANMAKVVAAPGVLANDTDANGDPLTVQQTGLPTGHGTLYLETNGSFTYTPYAGYEGTDSASYRAFDGREYSGIVTITFNVTNTAPVAMPDSYATHPGVAKTVDPSKGVLANDTDADGQTLTVEKMSDPANGTVSLSPSGSFTYTPDAGFEGDDTFTYRTYDGIAYSGTVAVTISVGNQAPQALADTYFTYTNTDKVVSAPGVLANDSDPEGDTMSADTVSDPSHGTVTLQPSGAFTYTPAAGYIGIDSFTYRVSDGLLYSNTVTVTITVATPSTPMPVYRFYRPSSGTHFYTADPAERDRVMATLSSIYVYEGPCYSVNTSNPANVVPLYRFYNRHTGTHLYTANEGEKNTILANLSGTYSLDGIAYGVSMSGGLQVHRFYSAAKGVHFYSADPSEIASVRANLPHVWQYEGPAYYVGQ